MTLALEVGFSLVVTLEAAVLFTNAVGILGGRLMLGQGAVGSVHAAAEFTMEGFGAYTHVPMLAGGSIVAADPVVPGRAEMSHARYSTEPLPRKPFRTVSGRNVLRSPFPASRMIEMARINLRNIPCP